jgi:hypothetical protein
MQAALSRALSGLSRRAVLQISLAAGASFLVVIGAVIFRTTSTGNSGQPSDVTQAVGAVPLPVSPGTPRLKPSATSVGGAGADDTVDRPEPIDMNDLPLADPGATADTRKSDEKKEPTTTAKPAAVPKKKATTTRSVTTAPKTTVEPTKKTQPRGIPTTPW